MTTATNSRPRVRLTWKEAQIEGGGGLTLGVGSFHSSPRSLGGGFPELKPAVNLNSISAKGGVWLAFGFKSEGALVLDRAKIGHALGCAGGSFINPGNVALTALSASIDGDVYLTDMEDYGDFVADGLIQFPAARVTGIFWVNHAKFKGKAGTPHGLDLSGATVDRGFGWHNVELQNGATLSLAGARVQGVADEEQSWPQPAI